MPRANKPATWRRLPKRALLAAFCLSLLSNTLIVVGAEAWVYLFVRRPRFLVSAEPLLPGQEWDRTQTAVWDVTGFRWGWKPGEVDVAALQVRPRTPTRWEEGQTALRQYGSSGRTWQSLGFTRRRAGWPWRATWMEFGTDFEQNQTTSGEGMIKLPAQLDAWMARVRGRREGPGVLFVPMLPLWPGLLADLVVHATLWSIPILGIFTFRAHRRRRRNHCARCNYDLTSTPPTRPCPECGFAADPVAIRMEQVPE